MAQIFDRGLAYADLLRLRSEYRKFRDEHWYAERGHIKIEYAEGLYQIFREGIIARRLYDKILRSMEPREPRQVQMELNFSIVAV